MKNLIMYCFSSKRPNWAGNTEGGDYTHFLNENRQNRSVKGKSNLKILRGHFSPRSFIM